MALDLGGLSMRLKLADDETEIDLAALQGLWSVEQYLKLTNQTNRLIEFTDGVIEVLPMPIRHHMARRMSSTVPSSGGSAPFPAFSMASA